MKRNRHEAADLVALADQLSAGCQRRPHLRFQVLDATRQAGYEAFRAAEFTDINGTPNHRFLAQSAALGAQNGIATYYTDDGSLDQVLATSSPSVRPSDSIPIQVTMGG